MQLVLSWILKVLRLLFCRNSILAGDSLWISCRRKREAWGSGKGTSWASKYFLCLCSLELF